MLAYKFDWFLYRIQLCPNGVEISLRQCFHQWRQLRAHGSANLSPNNIRNITTTGLLLTIQYRTRFSGSDIGSLIKQLRRVVLTVATPVDEQDVVLDEWLKTEMSRLCTGVFVLSFLSCFVQHSRHFQFCLLGALMSWNYLGVETSNKRPLEQMKSYLFLQIGPSKNSLFFIVPRQPAHILHFENLL